MKGLLIVFLSVTFSVNSQSKKSFTRIFQFSIAPGLSTNGLHPGGYTNYFSFNLTSGYSAANYVLEVGLVSNLNEVETRGLQLSGLANLTGANSFAGLLPREIDKMRREGFEPNLTGIQVSGITNVVLNNVFGAQFTGGINLAGGALQGIQIGGVANMVTRYTFGIQLAGLWNISVGSMDGLQLSSLYNITKNELFGIQMGLWNRAGLIQGKNSYENNDPTGLQLGLLNICRTMNGFQIGLVNVGSRMQGTQIGLINIYRNGKTPVTRDGTSIGLVNIGSSGYGALYASEIFNLNVEVATGTMKNIRMTGERTTREIHNGLIYGRNFNDRNWGIGYGLKKMFLNRASDPAYGHFRFIMAGIDLIHYNHSSALTKELSLIGRPNISAGSRFHPKNKTFFFFVSAAYNFYKSDSGKVIDALTGGNNNAEENYDLQHWAGFAAGVLIK
jgi:hypothetical protein